jgi:hypothetical protein
MIVTPGGIGIMIGMSTGPHPVNVNRHKEAIQRHSSQYFRDDSIVER